MSAGSKELPFPAEMFTSLIKEKRGFILKFYNFSQQKVITLTKRESNFQCLATFPWREYLQIYEQRVKTLDYGCLFGFLKIIPMLLNRKSEMMTPDILQREIYNQSENTLQELHT